jgi:hypothetical protein
MICIKYLIIFRESIPEDEEQSIEEETGKDDEKDN